MDPEAYVIMEKLAEVVNDNTHHIVAYYTSWHLIDAFAWMAFGVAVMIGAWKANCPKEWMVYAEYGDDEKSIPTWFIMTKWALFFVGLAYVAANTADVFSPEAYAIHQLIIDIRG